MTGADPRADPTATPPLLQARGLSIGWRGRGGREVAAGIDLELEGGELAVLVGPNGAGKSTLLRTLVGVQPALRGSARIQGRDAARLTVEERATLAACVFTDRFDPGFFSVLDFVAFGRYPYTGARNALAPKDREAVRRALEAVGLEGLARRLLAELSDGERQKAQIARAIAQDCPLLALDEPTAFLDAPARAEIMHLARELAHSAHKAVVLSTHDMDQALRAADRLWLLDGRGRLASGAPEDLAASGRIGRAFDGGGFRFDPRTGTFRSAIEGSPGIVVVSGPEGIARAWAERLVERLGYVPSREALAGSEPAARIAVEEGAKGTFFTLRIGEAEYEARSYDELGRRLAGARNAPG